MPCEIFNFIQHDYSACVFNSELTLVLDESGGPALKPLFIIVLKNKDGVITYRLKNVYFCSEYLFNIDTGQRCWLDAIGKASKLAQKIQQKGMVNLKYWTKLI